MTYTNKVIEILKNYENTNAGIKANLGKNINAWRFRRYW